jgi:inosine-uridine nucleoside N-ribohydrolase
VAPLPLVIDCDPGIDDALALLLAAASPEFDLLGVTCVAGNRPVDVTSDNAFCPGNITPSAEFNFHADALAAHTVVCAGATLSVFGLDVTRHVALPPAWIRSLGTLGNRCGPVASAMLQGYARPAPQLHDVCASRGCSTRAVLPGAMHGGRRRAARADRGLSLGQALSGIRPGGRRPG